jgi:xanthine dehydrogenase accessory factor
VEAEHLILTYSHALDLELCHRLLGTASPPAGSSARARNGRGSGRGSPRSGMGGSIARIRCPIGDPALGKHPQAIAVGVAHQLLNAGRRTTAWKDGTG